MGPEVKPSSAPPVREEVDRRSDPLPSVQLRAPGDTNSQFSDIVLPKNIVVAPELSNALATLPKEMGSVKWHYPKPDGVQMGGPRYVIVHIRQLHKGSTDPGLPPDLEAVIKPKAGEMIKQVQANVEQVVDHLSRTTGNKDVYADGINEVVAKQIPQIRGFLEQNAQQAAQLEKKYGSSDARTSQQLLRQAHEARADKRTMGELDYLHNYQSAKEFHDDRMKYDAAYRMMSNRKITIQPFEDSAVQQRLQSLPPLPTNADINHPALQERFNIRENHFIANKVRRGQKPFYVALVGGGHSFADNARQWNENNPHQPIAVAEITPRKHEELADSGRFDQELARIRRELLKLKDGK